MKEIFTRVIIGGGCPRLELIVRASITKEFVRVGR